MKIIILTLFPKMIAGFFKESIIKRAVEKKTVEIKIVNLRDFAIDDYGAVDDRPYGGGTGMVLRVDVIHRALSEIAKPHPKSKILLTSPKGKIFNQAKAQEYSKLDYLVIIAGHYEGVDERVSNFIDEEVSLGDFIMTGGEIASVAVLDAIVRLLPGTLKNKDATQQESFFNISTHRLIEVIGRNKILLDIKKRGIKEVALLEYPQYTRPDSFMGKNVPAVLLSGDHKEIEKWRLTKAWGETVKKRPDLLFNSC